MNSKVFIRVTRFALTLVAMLAISAAAATSASASQGVPLKVVLAWGNNQNGQLGTGTTGGIASAPVPVCEPGYVGSACPPSKYLKEVTAVAAGNQHSLALLKNETVLAWGENKFGELGNNILTTSPAPVHVCRVNWGSGACGPGNYLGEGGTETGEKVKELSAGVCDSLARLENGRVVAWGGNANKCGEAGREDGGGDLGDNTTNISEVPVHVCEVEYTGAAGTQCSAGNYLGEGTSNNPKVTQISSGAYHNVALLSTGTVVAWGLDQMGQLGNAEMAGNHGYRILPVRVCREHYSCPPTGPQSEYLENVKEVSAGSWYTLALLNNGKVKSWGDNERSELGNGTTGGGEQHFQHNTDTPGAVCSGPTQVTECYPPSGAGELEHIKAISASDSLSGFALTKEALVGWGFNGFGQLGQGSSPFEATDPLAAMGSPVYSAVSAGYVHSLALQSPGVVWAAGDNVYGELGDGTQNNTSNQPVHVCEAYTSSCVGGDYLETASAVSAGSQHNLALATIGPHPRPVTLAASSVRNTSATLNATVDPNGEEVIKCEIEYGTTTSYGSSAPCTPLPGSGEEPVAVSASVTGLAEATTYHFRIVAANLSGPSNGADETFTTGPKPPVAVTEHASSVTQSTATLNATVNPDGGNVTKCEFEYGTTTSYGSSAPCATLPGAGESPVAVSASVTGLTSNVTYHFRISATNAGGTGDGSDQAFTTLTNPLQQPPTVVTGSASSVTGTRATLSATVNPNGGEVSACNFEYGTSAGYGSSVACASLPGSGTSPVEVSASLGNLASNTTYHFRISASNPGGTSHGSDATFKTLGGAYYFRNSGGSFRKASKVAEGVRVPVIAWGNLELTAEGLPTTECENVGGGYIENPKGGGAGVGATESFNAFNCKNSTCLAPDFESVQARNLNGEHETSSEGPFGGGSQVKWPSVLEEKVTGTIRTNSSNVSMLVGCRESTGKLVAGTFVECFTEPGVDEQTPQWINGTGIGSNPSKTEFDEGSGSLNCSGAFQGKTGKSLKVMGYNEQEIIETAE